MRTREEIAHDELGHTDVTPALARLVVAAFLLIVASVPAAEIALQFRGGRSFPFHFDRLFARGLVPSAAELRDVERALERESLVREQVAPRARLLLVRAVGGAPSAQRAMVGGGTEDIVHTHRDPRVAFTMRPGEHQLLIGPPFSVRAPGLRVGPGSEPPPGALRIAVLGDSVALGAGLAAEDTIAAQLQAVLTEARGPDARPVACFTVAMPGWNCQNAVNFLFDYWAALALDMVVYFPIGNDLADSYAVDDDGKLHQLPDPLANDPLLPVSLEAREVMLLELLERHAAGTLSGGVTGDEIGPPALESDLTAESSRRYDANVAWIALLARRLEERGGKLLLVHYAEDSTAGWPYPFLLRERLVEADVDVAEAPGFAPLDAAITLPSDPHPNKAGARALAIWIAEEMLDRGWIDRGADRPLPEVSEELRNIRAPERSDADVAARAAEERARVFAVLQHEINPDTGRGVRQVYGGLNPDGTVATRLAAVLKAAGPELIVRIAPLETALLDPLELVVEVEGRRLGALVLPQDGSASEVEGRFALPADVARDAPIEVRLVPSDWTLNPFESMQIVASFRLRSVAAPPR